MSGNEDVRGAVAGIELAYPIRVSAISDKGPVREQNEDNMARFDSPIGHVVMVADGMGGHGHGDLASALVVNGFQETLTSTELAGLSVEEAIKSACSKVNARIVAMASQLQQSMMGSTVVFVVLRGDQMYVAHVGDSRAYLFRDGSLSRLTKDHSVVQREIDDGLLSEEQARQDSRSSMLTRALGTPNGDDIEISGPLTLNDGDGILLSSDGLHGFTFDRQIEDAILCNNQDPQKAVKGLINLAIGTYFSNDNVTVQYIQIGTPVTPKSLRPVYGKSKPAAAAAAAGASETPATKQAQQPRPLFYRVIVWVLFAVLFVGIGLALAGTNWFDRILHPKKKSSSTQSQTQALEAVNITPTLPPAGETHIAVHASQSPVLMGNVLHNLSFCAHEISEERSTDFVIVIKNIETTDPEKTKPSCNISHVNSSASLVTTRTALLNIER